MKHAILLILLLTGSGLYAGNSIREVKKGESFTASVDCVVIPVKVYRELSIAFLIYSSYEDFILKRENLFISPDKYINGLISEIGLKDRLIKKQGDYITHLEGITKGYSKFQIRNKLLSIGFSVSLAGVAVMVPFMVIGVQSIQSYIKNNFSY